MNARVYLLLEIMPGESETAARLLRNETCVLAVDYLEGPPDLIIVIEAPQRQSLAEFTIKAIASVESVTRDIQLLPVQDTPIRALTVNFNTTSAASRSATKNAAVSRMRPKNQHKGRFKCTTQ